MSSGSVAAELVFGGVRPDVAELVASQPYLWVLPHEVFVQLGQQVREGEAGTGLAAASYERRTVVVTLKVTGANGERRVGVGVLEDRTVIPLRYAYH